jgi:hypothetical protein
MTDLQARPFNFNYQPPTLEELASRWNGWRLVILPDDGAWLEYPAYPSAGHYPVGLESLTTSAEMLDVIMQIEGKSWATDACVAGLVRALNDLIDPQARLCSGGNSKTLTPAEIRRKVREKHG